MLSWKAQVSILEVLGLDFGVSKAGFQRIFRIFWEGFFQVSNNNNNRDFSKSSKKCLLKSFFQVNPPKMPKRLKMLKKLKRPTFFRVHTPRVRPRRAILPPWAGKKRVGGGGPPRGVTIKISEELDFHMQNCCVSS